ncbi:MAG TPA: helix-turn-helix domain-containing protein [Solirubrobacteraceae bacterium]|jgi:AcrR family transcriptional regulator|nr:helix-turn-helix domain-containing protein [Solirubrobacteraceae bacterium]
MAPAVRRGSLGRGARERILTAAAQLFMRQGFNATSINALRAAARVSKRTLYQHFESKDELIVAYLATYARRGPTAAVLDREDLAPRTRLLELFTALGDPQSTVPDPLVAAAAEFPDPEHPVHRAAAEHAQRFSEHLASLARAAGVADPERTARRLVTLYDGACARILLEDRATVVDDAYLMATTILRDAIG